MSSAQKDYLAWTDEKRSVTKKTPDDYVKYLTKNVEKQLSSNLEYQIDAYKANQEYLKSVREGIHKAHAADKKMVDQLYSTAKLELEEEVKSRQCAAQVVEERNEEIRAVEEEIRRNVEQMRAHTESMLSDPEKAITIGAKLGELGMQIRTLNARIAEIRSREAPPHTSTADLEKKRQEYASAHEMMVRDYEDRYKKYETTIANMFDPFLEGIAQIIRVLGGRVPGNVLAGAPSPPSGASNSSSSSSSGAPKSRHSAKRHKDEVCSTDKNDDPKRRRTDFEEESEQESEESDKESDKESEEEESEESDKESDKESEEEESEESEEEGEVSDKGDMSGTSHYSVIPGDAGGVLSNEKFDESVYTAPCMVRGHLKRMTDHLETDIATLFREMDDSVYYMSNKVYADAPSKRMMVPMSPRHGMFEWVKSLPEDQPIQRTPHFAISDLDSLRQCDTSIDTDHVPINYSKMKYSHQRVFSVAEARIRTALMDENKYQCYPHAAKKFAMQPHAFSGERDLHLERTVVDPGDPYMLYVNKVDLPYIKARFFLLYQHEANGPVYALYTINPDNTGKYCDVVDNERHYVRLKTFLKKQAASLFVTADNQDVHMVCPQLPRMRNDYYFALAWLYELLCETVDADGNRVDVIQSIVSRKILVDERELPMFVFQLLMNGHVRHAAKLHSMMLDRTKPDIRGRFMGQQMQHASYTASKDVRFTAPKNGGTPNVVAFSVYS